MSENEAGEVDVVEGYGRWAEGYDAQHNRTRDVAVRFVRDAVEGLSFDHAVEYGCGTGLVTEILARRSNRVTALDISPAMLDQARSRLAGSQVRLVEHDLTATPWPAPPPADLVVGTLVLEHVANPAPLIHEAARLLVPGGSLLMCEYHPYRQLVGRQARFTDATTGETVYVAAYPHRVSDFVSAAMDAGLRLTCLEEPRHPDDDEPWPRLLALIFERPYVDGPGPGMPF